MEHSLEANKIKIRTGKNFNLSVVIRIKKTLLQYEKSFEEIEINLSKTAIINSEAVRFLYEQTKNSKNICFINPPEIFLEILKILELEDIFKDYIIYRK